MFSFERRHCSTNSDEGVQFKTAEAFSESAIFTSWQVVVDFSTKNYTKKLGRKKKNELLMNILVESRKKVNVI